MRAWVSPRYARCRCAPVRAWVSRAFGTHACTGDTRARIGVTTAVIPMHAEGCTLPYLVVYTIYGIAVHKRYMCRAPLRVYLGAIHSRSHLGGTHACMGTGVAKTCCSQSVHAHPCMHGCHPCTHGCFGPPPQVCTPPVRAWLIPVRAWLIPVHAWVFVRTWGVTYISTIVNCLPTACTCTVRWLLDVCNKLKLRRP